MCVCVHFHSLSTVYLCKSAKRFADQIENSSWQNKWATLYDALAVIAHSTSILLIHIVCVLCVCTVFSLVANKQTRRESNASHLFVEWSIRLTTQKITCIYLYIYRIRSKAQSSHQMNERLWSEGVISSGHINSHMRLRLGSNLPVSILCHDVIFISHIMCFVSVACLVRIKNIFTMAFVCHVTKWKIHPPDNYSTVVPSTHTQTHSYTHLHQTTQHFTWFDLR